MYPHDPEYAEEMSKETFDPHISTAIAMGLITDEVGRAYVEKTLNTKERAEVAVFRDMAKPVNYMCLPTDNTEVLTERGWKTYKEITTEDKVLSLNIEKGKTEFCDVTGIVFHPQQKTIVKKHHSWTLESTPEHRWVVSERVWGDRKRYKTFYRTTEGLTQESRIVSSAPYIGGASKVTPEEAATVGWILSEGYLKVSDLKPSRSQGMNGERRQVICSVSQSEKKFLKEMKEDIDGTCLEYSEDVRENGVHILRFRSQSFRDFWSGVGLPLENKDAIDYTEWLLGLSVDALESFFNAFYLGDGHTTGVGMKYSTKVIHQKAGKICDAIQLCSELLGRKTYVKQTKDVNVVRSRNSPYLGMQRTKKEEGRYVDVFCLTTENGNFVIRQNGIITITGNCVYGGTYKALMRQTGWDEQRCKDAIKAYWDKNWSVKAIAEEQVTIIDSRNKEWLINPINGFLYNIRSEKDRFSTLAQGTGAFLFDMWLDDIITTMKERWGRATLTAQMHDELVIVCKDTQRIRKVMYDIIKGSVKNVSEKFKLRRELDCDVAFGKSYAEVH